MELVTSMAASLGRIGKQLGPYLLLELLLPGGSLMALALFLYRSKVSCALPLGPATARR